MMGQWGWGWDLFKLQLNVGEKKCIFKCFVQYSHLPHKLLLDPGGETWPVLCSQCLSFLAQPYLGNSVFMVRRVNLSNLLTLLSFLPRWCVGVGVGAAYGILQQ